MIRSLNRIGESGPSPRQRFSVLLAALLLTVLQVVAVSHLISHSASGDTGHCEFCLHAVHGGDALVAAAAPRMSRSETVVHQTGGNEINAARTSQGMFFGRGESPLCQRIEARIAALLNWPVVNGEGLQVLHYRPGAEYKPHHDYFDPAQPGMAAVLARGGQRVGTLVIYLNTPDQGGGTTFPDVGLEVGPIKGNAVFFSYDRPQAATRSLHGGAPVLAGEKWVATKWLRAGEFV